MLGGSEQQFMTPVPLEPGDLGDPLDPLEYAERLDSVRRLRRCGPFAWEMGSHFEIYQHITKHYLKSQIIRKPVILVATPENMLSYCHTRSMFSYTITKLPYTNAKKIKNGDHSQKMRCAL